MKKTAGLETSEVLLKSEAMTECMHYFNEGSSVSNLIDRLGPFLPFGFVSAMLAQKKVGYERKMWPLSYRQCIEGGLVPHADAVVNIYVPMYATAYINVETGKHIKRNELSYEEISSALAHGMVARDDIFIKRVQGEFFDAFKCHGMHDEEPETWNIDEAAFRSILIRNDEMRRPTAEHNPEEVLRMLCEKYIDEEDRQNQPYSTALVEAMAGLVKAFKGVDANNINSKVDFESADEAYEALGDEYNSADKAMIFMKAFDAAAEITSMLLDSICSVRENGFKTLNDLVKDTAADSIAGDALASYLRTLAPQLKRNN